MVYIHPYRDGTHPMTRGTPLTPLRPVPELLARIYAEVEPQNLIKRGKPYNRSSWIRHAIEEKLAKLERTRTSTRKKKGKATEWSEEDGAPIF